MAKRYTLTCSLVAMLTWGATAASGTHDVQQRPAEHPVIEQTAELESQATDREKSVDGLLREKLEACRDLSQMAATLYELGPQHTALDMPWESEAAAVEAEIAVRQSEDARELIDFHRQLVEVMREREAVLRVKSQVGGVEPRSRFALTRVTIARLDAEIALARLMSNYVPVQLNTEVEGDPRGADGQ